MQLRVYTSLAVFIAATAATVTAATTTTTVGSEVETAQSSLPSCALSCEASAIAASGCDADDSVCLCTTGAKSFLSAGETCLLEDSDCTASELQEVQSIVKSGCSAILASSSASASASGSASESATSSPTVSAISAVEAAVTSASTTSATAAASTSGASYVGVSIAAVGLAVFALLAS